MSPLLLRTFVNERLSALLGEILQVFEGAISKYEEEASSSKQEIERLRGLLQEQLSRRTDVPQSSPCKDKTPWEEESGLHHGTSELRYIKEEDPELWTADHEEKQQAGTEADVLNLPPAFVREEPEQEQEDTKPPDLRWTQSSVSVDIQDVKEAEPAEVRTPPLPVPPSQDKASILTPDQAERSQYNFVPSRECTDSPHLNSPGADYQCSMSGESFPSGHLLLNHAFQAHSRDVGVPRGDSLRSHGNSKCCPLCGKLFRSGTSLREHMAGHAGLKPHRCHVCGKECRRKGDLKIHLRIHTGEKPFCCSLCCKSFTHSGHLKKHIRSHTGERPYRCDVCGRGFLQSGHLKSHLGTHAQKK